MKAKRNDNAGGESSGARPLWSQLFSAGMEFPRLDGPPVAGHP